MRPFGRIAGGLVLVALLGATSPASVAEAANTPGVLPPQSNAFGKGYAELSVAWWQWAAATDAACAPAPGTGGNVWFLRGTTGDEPGTPPTQRVCEIPTGAALFFPIINVEWSVAEGPCPLDTSGGPSNPLRACARAFMNHVTALEASIDGRQLRDLWDYRVSSRVFEFNPVPGNVFGLPPGQTQAASDGYWLLLTPLPPGTHTVHFRGAAVFPEFDGFEFISNVTYTVKVVPGRR